MPRRSLARLYKDEFTGYSLAKFQHDLLAGLTVVEAARVVVFVVNSCLVIVGSTGQQCGFAFDQQDFVIFILLG